MLREWQEERDYSELEKPTDARIRRQSWVGALQEEFIGSINKKGNFESRKITSSPYGWKSHSFATAKGDSDRFKLMFPDSTIAKGYCQCDSEFQCSEVIKYGIAYHLKKQLIYDVKNVPYSFVFDETINSQVKKAILWVCDLLVQKVWSYCSFMVWIVIFWIKWNSWTLIPSSCFIFGWMDPMLTCPLRKNLHRSCLTRIHPYSSWYHVHPIHFTLHFRRGLSSLFRDRFHQQHETVKVLENFLRRKGLLI